MFAKLLIKKSCMMFGLINTKRGRLKQVMLFVLLSLFVFSCSHSSVNEKINKVGEVVGEASGELAKGLGNGATKAFDVKIDLAEELKKKGLSIGKTTLSSDSTGTDNLLSAYLIFDKDFSGKITAKIFDNKSKEMGRINTMVDMKAGDAKYIDFDFDKRTNIDSDCTITIE